jgi:hypothetical protein
MRLPRPTFQDKLASNPTSREDREGRRSNVDGPLDVGGCPELRTASERIGALRIHGTCKFIIQTMLILGVNDTQELARLTGEHPRTVQRAKRAFETEGRQLLSDAHGSNASRMSPDRDSTQSFRDTEVACANDVATSTSLMTTKLSFHKQIPTPSSPLKERSPPAPPLKKIHPPSPRESFFPSAAAEKAIEPPAVTLRGGSLFLSDSERADWLPRFGNDPVDLGLALVQAAAYVQPHGLRPLVMQVRAQLARTARETRDRDRRYAVAASNKPQSIEDQQAASLRAFLAKHDRGRA